MVLNCPRCGDVVVSPPEREWQFQQYKVSRFLCGCGDKFNFYAGKMKSFTIPRPNVKKGLCVSCKTQNPAHALYCKNCGTKLSMAN